MTVVCARHHVRPKPSSCELPVRTLLVVWVAIVDQHPTTFLNFLQPESMCPVEPAFAPFSRLFHPRRRSPDVFRSSLINREKTKGKGRTTSNILQCNYCCHKCHCSFSMTNIKLATLILCLSFPLAHHSKSLHFPKYTFMPTNS